MKDTTVMVGDRVRVVVVSWMNLMPWWPADPVGTVHDILANGNAWVWLDGHGDKERRLACFPVSGLVRI